jgi:hypothetical protein
MHTRRLLLALALLCAAVPLHADIGTDVSRSEVSRPGLSRAAAFAETTRTARAAAKAGLKTIPARPAKYSALHFYDRELAAREAVQGAAATEKERTAYILAAAAAEQRRAALAKLRADRAAIRAADRAASAK